MVNNTKKALIFFLLQFLIFSFCSSFDAQAQDFSISLAFTDTTICKGDSIKQIINFTGTKKFYLIFEDEPSRKNEFNNSSITLGPYSEDTKIVIIEHGDADTSITDTITYTVEVAPTVGVALSGGGTFCRDDSIQPIVAYFSGTAPWTFVYIENGVEEKIDTYRNRVTLAEDESAEIETKMISDVYCTDNHSNFRISLVLNGIPAPVISGPKELCIGETALYSTDLVDDAKYNWTINTGAESLDVIHVHYRNVKWIEAGIHRVSLSLEINDSVCPTSESYIDVVVNPLPQIESNFDTAITCFDLEPLYYIFPGADQRNEVYWPQFDQYSHSIAVSGPGDYYFVETTPESCSDTGNYVVKNLCQPELYVAEAFTPNGDNINDVLEIFGFYVNLKINFYNPYGELLFTYNQYGMFWDGMSKGVKVPNGTYLWVAEYEDGLGETFQEKGKVIIIR